MSRSDAKLSGPLREVYEREIARLRGELRESERARVRAALALPPRAAAAAKPAPARAAGPDPRVASLEAELEEARETVAALMRRASGDRRRWKAVLLALRKRLKKAAPGSAGRLAALERELEESRETQANLLVQVARARRGGRARAASDGRKAKRARPPASALLSAARDAYAAAGLTAGLRLTAEAGTPGGELCDPAAVLEEALAAWTPAFSGRGVAVERAIKPSARKAAVRASALRAVLDELLANAAERLPSGAQLDLVAGDAPGGKYGIAVSDNGPGLPAEWRKAPFPSEPRPAPKRPGLGLSVSRELLRLRGGELTVYVTAAIKGARMTIRLPSAG